MSALLLTVKSLFFFLMSAHPMKQNLYFFLGRKYMDCVYKPRELMDAGAAFWK